MIEQQLRDEFARREAEVPAASPLVSRINAAAARRRRGRLVIRSSAAGLAVLMIALAAPMVARQWAAVSPLVGPGSPAMTALPAGPVNFLLVGLDRLPSWPADMSTRTDAIIIAHVPADRSGVQLVTIPRDLWVDLPPVPERDFPGGPGKINSAYSRGGLPLLERALTTLTGVTFAGSVVVELAGLTGLVDELGGVYYCLDQRVVSFHTGRTFEVGCRSFSGGEMRDLLRQRRTPNGALDRDRHNAQFLAALIKQVVRDGSVADLGRLRAAYVALRSYVTIDTRGLDAVDVAWQLRSALDSIEYVGMQVKLAQTEGAVVPGTNGASLFEALRADTVPAWIAAHRDDPLFEW